MERRSHPLHAFRSVALLSCIAVLSSQSQAIADVGITPGGVTHSRDSTYARSVVRITAGGPDCFGVIVTRNILIAPLVACARITPGLQDPVEFQAPDFTGSKRIKAVVAELSEKFGFIILKFEHTLPADAIARELRLADDDSYSHAGDLSSIRALSNKTDPIGSPCVSRTQNDSLIFECDDSQAPIIVGGSHIVAIAKRSGGYALARSIIESSDILKALEPPPSKGIVVSQPDGDDNDEAEQSADNNSLSEKLPSLYEDSQALIVAASEYKGVWSVLPTIPKESDDLAKALIQQGFKVRVYANPRSGMLYPVLKSFLTEHSCEWFSGRLL